MSSVIKLKRSADPGKVPTTSNLDLGEIAVNTYDGKMYIKKKVGVTESIVTFEAGGGGSGSAVNNYKSYVYAISSSQSTFTGMIVARQQAAGGTQTAAWKVDGLIRRESSAATTTLVNSAITVISNVPGWGIAFTADTTNGGLAVTVTGAAATNIRWVATVNTSEVTYA